MKEQRRGHDGSRRNEMLDLVILLATAIAMAGFFAPALPRLSLPSEGWTSLSFAFLVLLLGYSVFRNRDRLHGVLRGGVWLLAVILVLLVTRLPFFVHHLASLNSDRAVTLMMVENIREGASRPIYFYGQLYQGSLDAYLYSLVPGWLAPPPVTVLVGNLVLLAVFAGCSILLLQRLSGSRSFFLMLLVFGAPVGAMLFVFLDRVHGFALVAALLGILLYLVYQCTFEDRESFLGVGFVAGLLFWCYQPSLAWIVSLFAWLFAAGVVSRRWKTCGKACWQLSLGAVVGALPHFLSELNNDWANTKRGWANITSFLAGSERLGIADPTAALAAVLRLDVSFALGEIVWYGVVLLSLLGMGLSLGRGIARRDPRWLYLPLVLGVSLGLLLLSGFPPEERYLVHYRWYGLSAVLFAALLCQEARFLSLPNRRRLQWMAGAVFVTSTLVGSVAAHRRLAAPHENERLAIESLRSAGVNIVLGDYWNTLRFAPFLDSDTLITAAPSFRYPNAVLDSAKYPPRALRLGETWENEEPALLSRHSERRRIERLLEGLEVSFSSRVLDGFVLYSGFAAGLSAELCALLVEGGASEPDVRSGAYRRLKRRLQALPQPAFEGEGVTLPALNGQAAPIPEELRSGWKYVLQGATSRITLALDPGQGRRYTLPSSVGWEQGTYRTHLYYLGRPVHDYGPVELPGSNSGLLLSRLADETSLLGREGTERRRGLPLGGFSVTVPHEAVERLDIELYSLFDFRTSLWTRRYQQALLVDEEEIPLRYGENTVSLPVVPGQTVHLDTRYKSLWGTQDSLGSPGFQNAGAVLERIRVHADEGSYEVEPFLTAEEE